MVTQSVTVHCLLQFETAEEYKADMGIGELNHGEHEDATGGPSWPPTGPWFDRAKETRTKHAVDTSGEPRKEWIRQHQAALEQRLRTEKLQAERADAVMKQLLGGHSPFLKCPLL